MNNQVHILVHGGFVSWRDDDYTPLVVEGFFDVGTTRFPLGRYSLEDDMSNFTLLEDKAKAIAEQLNLPLCYNDKAKELSTKDINTYIVTVTKTEVCYFTVNATSYDRAEEIISKKQGAVKYNTSISYGVKKKDV